MTVTDVREIIGKVLNQYLAEEIGNKVSQFSVKGLAASLEQEFLGLIIEKEKSKKVDKVRQEERLK